MSLNHQTASQIAAVLTESLPYITRFTGKTMVIKYGGNAMVEDSLKKNFARDIVLMKLVGMNPIVVHGGGPQTNALQEKHGLVANKIGGRRVTSEADLVVVKQAICGEVNVNLTQLLQGVGVNMAITCEHGIRKIVVAVVIANQGVVCDLIKSPFSKRASDILISEFCFLFCLGCCWV